MSKTTNSTNSESAIRSYTSSNSSSSSSNSSSSGYLAIDYPGNNIDENDLIDPLMNNNHLTHEEYFQTNGYCNKNIIPTNDDIDFFQKNGYITYDNFLDTPEKLNYWRNAVTYAVSKRNNNHRFPTKGQEDTTNVDFEYYLNVFIQRINLYQNDKCMNIIFQNCKETLGRIATTLSSTNNTSSSSRGGMRLWHEQALFKQPYANSTSWHIDVPYWSFDSEYAISAWIALDDSTKDNGCLYFIPGSHHDIINKYKDRKASNNPVLSYNEVNGNVKTSSYFDEIKIGKNMSDLFTQQQQQQQQHNYYYPNLSSSSTTSKTEPKAIPLKAGSISFHHGCVIHGANCNMTNKWRRAMSYQFMPVGSTFNGKQNILTNEQYNALSIGDELNNDDINPLMYQCDGT